MQEKEKEARKRLNLAIAENTDNENERRAILQEESSVFPQANPISASISGSLTSPPSPLPYPLKGRPQNGLASKLRSMRLRLNKENRVSPGENDEEPRRESTQSSRRAWGGTGSMVRRLSEELLEKAGVPVRKGGRTSTASTGDTRGSKQYNGRASEMSMKKMPRSSSMASIGSRRPKMSRSDSVHSVTEYRKAKKRVTKSLFNGQSEDADLSLSEIAGFGKNPTGFVCWEISGLKPAGLVTFDFAKHFSFPPQLA